MTGGHLRREAGRSTANRDLGSRLEDTFGFRHVWSTGAIAAPWFVGAALLEHPPRRDTRFALGDDAYLAGPYEELLSVLKRERTRRADHRQI